MINDPIWKFVAAQNARQMASSVAVAMLLAQEAKRDVQFLETSRSAFEAMLAAMADGSLAGSLDQIARTNAQDHFQAILALARDTLEREEPKPL